MYQITSDNLLMHSRMLKRSGSCSNQKSFHQLLNVVRENGLKWRAIVRKKHLGVTKRLEKLFEERKVKIAVKLLRVPKLEFTVSFVCYSR